MVSSSSVFDAGCTGDVSPAWKKLNVFGFSGVSAVVNAAILTASTS